MAILVIEHSDLCGVERLGQTLRDYGHRLRFINLHDGESLPDLDDIDGVISCGGPQSVAHDRPDWLDDEAAYLRSAHEAELPVIGLCLGSQILAHAFGGEVSRMSDGLEFGWHEIALSDPGKEDIVHTGIPWRSIMFHHHEDEVTKVPGGARVLARSPRCGVEAWAMGVRTYAFQHHPEITRTAITRWVDEQPDLLERAGMTREQLDQQTEQHFDEFERLTSRLFESIALFCMPINRRYRGMAKDLHH